MSARGNPLPTEEVIRSNSDRLNGAQNFNRTDSRVRRGDRKKK